MHGDTSIGAEPGPPVDPIPQKPAPHEPPSPGLDKEEPGFVDEPDLPAGEPSGAPNEPAEGGGSP